jgi:uncharacterized protein YdeI (YjbR/CyaY-like superfamily)
MAIINKNASNLIDDYIENLPNFSKEICIEIRKIMHTAEPQIIEDWKWNIPFFCFENEKIGGFAAFKKHVTLHFFNGVQMSNQHQLFDENCNALKTRHIKFKTASEINKNQLFDYFKEAFLLKNTSIKTAKKKSTIELPEILQVALANNKLAKTNFDKMAYTYRKEYALHISEAKRETTKISRLAKVMSNLEKNIKMHEQFKC